MGPTPAQECPPGCREGQRKSPTFAGDSGLMYHLRLSFIGIPSRRNGCACKTSGGRRAGELPAPQGQMPCGPSPGERARVHYVPPSLTPSRGMVWEHYHRVRGTRILSQDPTWEFCLQHGSLQPQGYISHLYIMLTIISCDDIL